MLDSHRDASRMRHGRDREKTLTTLKSHVSSCHGSVGNFGYSTLKPRDLNMVYTYVQLFLTHINTLDALKTENS